MRVDASIRVHTQGPRDCCHHGRLRRHSATSVQWQRNKVDRRRSHPTDINHRRPPLDQQHPCPRFSPSMWAATKGTRRRLGFWGPLGASWVRLGRLEPVYTWYLLFVSERPVPFDKPGSKRQERPGGLAWALQHPEPFPPSENFSMLLLLGDSYGVGGGKGISEAFRSVTRRVARTYAFQRAELVSGALFGLYVISAH
ncbi:hypothetical protein FA13DRAFT_1241265 [Coprinellus micaceus]|uniref:Uncharacterized protein n=1 Tax=Coprinellus micaceus TaxID=71717 RepID=A0A4Y7TRR1_COPMI|nr:hypothetical protein FA13DRAFT_1241265 [Coprinellus micaceus]